VSKGHSTIHHEVSWLFPPPTALSRKVLSCPNMVFYITRNRKNKMQRRILVGTPKDTPHQGVCYFGIKF